MSLRVSRQADGRRVLSAFHCTAVRDLDMVPRLKAKADGLLKGEEGRSVVQRRCHHCPRLPPQPNSLLGSPQVREGVLAQVAYGGSKLLRFFPPPCVICKFEWSPDLSYH